jgi:phage baseplate assembly protein W
MNYTPYLVSINGASYIDINTGFTVNTLPDRVADELSVVVSGLVNLFGCPIGARGRIFEPTYGCEWWNLLQEPLDDITGKKIKTSYLQAIQMWEPRVTMNVNGTSIVSNYTVPGYDINLDFIYNITGKRETAQFVAPVTSRSAQARRG